MRHRALEFIVANRRELRRDESTVTAYSMTELHLHSLANASVEYPRIAKEHVDLVSRNPSWNSNSRYASSRLVPP